MSALILASASPRRADLLDLLAVSFEVRPTAVDETPHTGETPADYARRVANAKATAAHAMSAGAPILAADTTVSLDNVLFGKPCGAADAASTLRQLSGRTHSVMTAVVVIGRDGARYECLAQTAVRFRTLDTATIANYVASGEALDKAGAYGIQGLGGALVAAIDGHYSTVVGLPLPETAALLDRVSVPHALSATADA